MMQNKHLWVVVAVLSAIVACWGSWVMLEPRSAVLPAEPLKSILMEHVEYLPEVYRTHENYAGQLQNDTSAVLIYRYSPNPYSPLSFQDERVMSTIACEECGVETSLKYFTFFGYNIR